MIQYSLKCENDHAYDSWFQSAEAYDKLCSAGLLSCEICGSTKVSKAIMAPHVNSSKKRSNLAPSVPEKTDMERAVEDLRTHVESTSEYVGTKFVQEARDIYLGDKPERPIYGEAKPEEAKKLIEDGVPVMPLPFRPKKKTN